MEGQKNCSNPDGWSYNWTSEKISIKVDRGQLVELLPIDDLAIPITQILWSYGGFVTDRNSIYSIIEYPKYFYTPASSPTFSMIER